MLAVTAPDPAQPGQGRASMFPSSIGFPWAFPAAGGSRLQEGEESLLFGVLEHSAGVVPGCGRAPGLAVHE